jgi:hypothetical protein
MTRIGTLAAATLLAAPAAMADMAPAMVQTLDICAGSGQPFDARLAALTLQGWAPLDLTTDESAARQLAPYDLIFVRAYGLLDDSWDPVSARQRLDRASESMAGRLSRDVPGIAVLVQPDGALLWLSITSTETEVLCVIAAPGLTADVVGVHFGLILESRPRLPIMMNHWRSDAPGDIRFIDTLSFTPGAFADHEPWPLVAIFSPEVPQE